MRRGLAFGKALGAVGLTLAVPALGSLLRPAPGDAVRRFHAQLNDSVTAEDQLTCVLVSAGKPVCPLLIGEIRDPSQSLRRYEISAIGSLACEHAVPTLTRILHDDGEREWFRGDALEALWLIERPAAEALARESLTRSDYLGATASRLLQGHAPFALSYWDAMFCSHDRS